MFGRDAECRRRKRGQQSLEEGEILRCKYGAAGDAWASEHSALKLPTGSSKSSSVSLYEGQIHVVAEYLW